MGIAEKFAEKFISAINSMTPDLADIYAGSHRQAMGDWHARQVAMVTASGAGSAILPGYHLAAMVADVAFVVNRLGVAGHGAGAILGYQAGRGDILGADDMAAIVLYWVGADDFTAAMKQAALGRTVAGFMPLVAGNPVAVNSGVHTMMGGLGYLAGQKVGSKAGAKAGGKLGAKVAGQLAAKLSAKLSGKVLSGFVPILGAVVAGGVNAWIVDGILDAAKDYYTDKLGILGGGAAGRALPGGA
ncbi:hypothetical protein [Actinoplanes xinjiangensis]|uniref:hypothetical protein n=1 Tax=Actinoplanes xinjiangensis TaxID=512350 RepID=UPI00130E092C|nr:hypothetical protein [Actinoplanes xinjiangensis]